LLLQDYKEIKSHEPVPWIEGSLARVSPQKEIVLARRQLARTAKGRSQGQSSGTLRAATTSSTQVVKPRGSGASPPPLALQVESWIRACRRTLTPAHPHRP